MNIALIIIGIFVAVFIIFAVFRRALGTERSDAILPGTFELLEIQILKDTDTSQSPQEAALAAENLFASLHGLLREEIHLQEHFSFEILASKQTGVRFYAAIPNTILKYVEGQIYAQYPEARIKVVADYAQEMGLENDSYQIATLNFVKDDFFPIKTYRDMEVDPLSSITSVLAEANEGETTMIQYLVKPVGDVWQDVGHSYVESIKTGKTVNKGSSFFGNAVRIFAHEATNIAAGVATGWMKYHEASEATLGKGREEVYKMTSTEELQVEGIENKTAKMGFEVEVRFISSAKNIAAAESKMRLISASFQQFSTSSLNQFKLDIKQNKEAYLTKYRQRLFEIENAIILNTEELATIFHLPSAHLESPNISWVYSRKTEPPTNLPTNDCVYIGETVFRSHRTRFGLKEGDDRLRHMYIIGKSGTGKSTLFETMIAQDIQNGHGVGLMDPHGETVEKILDRIPDHRVDDVIYFDPADTEHPVGLNLLQIDDPNQKNLLASGLVSAIKQHFDFSWGPRLEYLLNYCVLTLLEVPGTTMLGITRLMEDTNYQKFILHHVQDPMVQKFWDKEFKEMKGNQKLVTEAIAPIQNKVNRFLASSTIRNILSQRKSTIDIYDAMNNGKILLMNLSKGKIGADNANLLGALLVSRVQFYALQRANIPYQDRRPFYLYVDEFQNFATGSFEEILSESRKYKLGLYLTHQFTAQLPEELLKAVYGNVGTIATFSLGAPDAKALANEFAPYFTAEDIISLERFEIYIKLMIDGMTSIPFSGKIFTPWLDPPDHLPPVSGNRERVIGLSREKYGRDKAYIEEKTKKWVDTQFDKGMAIALENRMKNAGNTNLNEGDSNE